MNNFDVKLRTISKIEEIIYILERVAEGDDYHSSNYLKKRIENSFSYPREPIAPYEKTQPIPPYDKALYVKKAKAEGTVEAGRRTGWILAAGFCSSVIGLIIGIPILIFMIISWPFSQGIIAKAAYKMYIADCEELERKNARIELGWEQYNKAMATFQENLDLYQVHKANMPLKSQLCNKSLQQIYNLVSKLKKYSYELYDDFSIPSEYKNFVAIHMLCHYVDKYKLTSISDAMSMLGNDYASGKVWFDIKHIQNNKEAFAKNMPSVISEIQKCDDDIDILVDGLIELCNNLGQPGKENSASALYTKFIQQCTDIARI